MGTAWCELELAEVAISLCIGTPNAAGIVDWQLLMVENVEDAQAALNIFAE